MSEESREARLSAAFVRLTESLTADYDVIDLMNVLLEESITILDTQAAGLLLADPSGTLQLVASTSEKVNLVEIMQLNAGEGPCLDCFTTGVAVTMGDIEHDGQKWPKFREAAVREGFRSVHATPMRSRGQVIGSLNLLSTTVGRLNSRDIAVAQALTDVATIGLLHERLASESSIVTGQLQYALDTRIYIEQAKGVLAEQLKIEMDEAFIALRDYARGNNITLRTVAEGVTSRSIVISAAASSPARHTT